MEALGGNWMAKINSKKHKMDPRARNQEDMDHHPRVCVNSSIFRIKIKW
jgi:hypothetical protein